MEPLFPLAFFPSAIVFKRQYWTVSLYHEARNDYTNNSETILCVTDVCV